MDYVDSTVKRVLTQNLMLVCFCQTNQVILIMNFFCFKWFCINSELANKTY